MVVVVPTISVRTPYACAPRERSEDDSVVRLPPLQFACAWLAMLLVRIACVVTLVTFSLTNSALATPKMEYYASLIAPASMSLFAIAAWLAAVIGLAHMYKITKMLVHSIRAKQLVFCDRPCIESTTAVVNTGCAPLRVLLVGIKSAVARLFDRKGFFGTDSAHFEALFLFRELLEMVSQTVQVYTSSTLIARHWINSLFVTVVFINSFSTPFATRVLRQSRAHRRLACLVADTVIDIVASMVIPLIIIMPYYMAFDMAALMLEITILYDMSKFVSLVMEMRQIFVRNGFDLVTKMLPHMSIYGCLGSIQSLLRPMGTAVAGATTAGKPPLQQLQQRGPAWQVSSTLESPRARAYVHAVFFFWGCCVVVFHVLAVFPSYRAHAPGCKLLYRPWFSAAYSCSVYEYNCYKYGTVSPPERDFITFVDDSSMSALVLSHCPALVVPAAIQRFSNLIGFEIWNSTIVSWHNESGLRQAAHPVLQYTCLVDVNLTGIPDGLLYDLPRGLYDIEIVRSNLSALPDDLDAHWARAGIIYIEQAQLTEMPPPLWRRAIPDFSVAGNRITALSNAVTEPGGNFFRVAFSGNPLTKLPEHLGDLRDLQVVALENTLVTDLPDWIYNIESRAFKIYLAGTPFCAVKSMSEIAARFGRDAVITCVDTNPYSTGRYPTEKMRPLQQLEGG